MQRSIPMSGLFGSTILEVAIGMFFLYKLLSIVCSGIHEVLAGWWIWRAKDLERGLGNLLCDPKLFEEVFKHPLIKALGNTNAEARLVKWANRNGCAGAPSYIPAGTFTLAL